MIPTNPTTLKNPRTTPPTSIYPFTLFISVTFPEVGPITGPPTSHSEPEYSLAQISGLPPMTTISIGHHSLPLPPLHYRSVKNKVISLTQYRLNTDSTFYCLSHRFVFILKCRRNVFNALKLKNTCHKVIQSIVYN